MKDIVEWVVANAKERALAGSDQVPVAVEVSVPVASGEKISNLFLLGRMWDVDSNERSARECMGVLEVHREGNALRQTLYLAEILRHGGVVDLAPVRQVEMQENALLTRHLAEVGQTEGELMAAMVDQEGMQL